MSKISILYVEDYPVVQQMYASVLKQQFDVDVVADGKLALEKTKAKDYDIILLDLLLPQVGGVEFLEAYNKEHKNSKKTRIIILSDFDHPSTVKRTKELGVDDYWMKVDTAPHALVEKLGKLPKPQA